jgi:hypothetical protein
MRRAINVPITRVGRRRSGPRESPALDAGADATPEATRDFPSTESLLIRFDAYSPGGDARSLNAAVLSRAGRRTFDVPVTRAPAGASHQNQSCARPAADLRVRP